MEKARSRRNTRAPSRYGDLVTFSDLEGTCDLSKVAALDIPRKNKLAPTGYKDRDDFVVADSKLAAPGAEKGLFCKTTKPCRHLKWIC
jgi:hypothetical protein